MIITKKLLILAIYIKYLIFILTNTLKYDINFSYHFLIAEVRSITKNTKKRKNAMKKLMIIAAITITSLFFSNSLALANKIEFEVDKKYSSKPKANLCDVCLPEYIIVWGKGEKGVKWFLKNHYANHVIFLKDVYTIPKECQIGDEGHMIVRKDETFFLKSNKVGIADKYYRFVSKDYIQKNKTKKNMVGVSIPDNMPDGTYWLGIIGTLGFKRSQPAIIKGVIRDGKLVK